MVAIAQVGHDPGGVLSRLLMPLVCLGLLFGCAWPSQARRELEQQWAVDVLLGAESGARRAGVVRWRGPVRFLLVDPDPRLQRAVEAAYAQLCAALGDLHRLEFEVVGSSDLRVGQPGFVTIFAVAPREAGELAQRLGAMPPGPAADGWFSIAWNAGYELTRALVFIDPKLERRWLRHTALEELFQALGPSNDSSLLPDSLIYEGERSFGSSDRLARVDAAVLRALYGRLEPGAGAEAIVAALAGAGRTGGG